MIQAAKELIKQTVIYDKWLDIRRREELKEWKRSGSQIPPPHPVKVEAIKEYARKFSLTTLVETGTCLGLMILATRNLFDRIYSVELDNKLYERACRLFDGFEHITVLQGDSGTILPDILKKLTEPCLFWLDSHYTGEGTAKGVLETPIIQELQHIFNHPIKDHVILIDDARLFIGENDYPTIEELKNFVLERQPDRSIVVKDDIIRF